MKLQSNVDVGSYSAGVIRTPLSPELKWKDSVRRMAQACFAPETDGVATTSAAEQFANYFRAAPPVGRS